MLAHAATADFAGVANGFLDVGNFHYFVVEHHAQTFAHVRGGEAVEALTTLACQGKVHVRLAVLIGAGLRIAQIFASNSGDL